MNNSKKAKKSLQRRIDSFNNFFEYVDTINKIVPGAKKLKERTEWELETLEKLPIKLQSSIDNTFVNSLYATTAYVDSNLPTPQVVNVNSLSAMVTADSTTVLSLVMQFDSEEPEIHNWAVVATQSYRALQKRQEVENEVFKKLQRLNNEIAKNFRRSLDEYEKAIALNKITSNIANNFRNILYKVRGELWNIVKKPSEQKIDWVKLSDRISIEGSGAPERIKLKDMENHWKKLHSILSTMDKDKNKYEHTKEEIEDVKTMYLDYLFTILNLVRLV